MYCVGSGNCFLRLETKQETFIVSLFSCFCLELAQLFRVAGRSGMTYVAWIVAVCFCETWNGCSRKD